MLYYLQKRYIGSEATTGMARLLSERELEDRMDCYGDFDVTDEICLKRCGMNVSCASARQEEEDLAWLEDDILGLPDVNLD